MGQDLHVTSDASFDADIMAQPGLALVDFWAPWCAPCRTIAPILDELARDYAGEVTIAKINADENPLSGEAHAVRSLPTLILFRDGVEIERINGAATKTRIATLIDRQLEA